MTESSLAIFTQTMRVCEELQVFVQMLSESFRPAKPDQLVKDTNTTLIRELLKS